MQTTSDTRPDDRAPVPPRPAGNVLRGRLVRIRRDGPPPAPAPRNPERVIAAAVSRAADRVHQLPLYFDRVETTQTTLAEIAECLPEQALLSLVEGPGDAIGVVAISPTLLGSLIEMQAIGRVSSRQMHARRPTATDAAVCADFVDACLSELAAELATMPGYDGVGGYRYASFLGDPRPLDLLLEDVAYRRVHLALRAGDSGQRDGTLTFLLPLACPQRALPDMTGDAAGTSRAAAHADVGVTSAARPASDMSEAVAAAGVRLRAVLARRKLSLGELKALAPGQMLTLPRSCLENATLETASGQVLATGKAGESAGCHAVRLHGGAGARGAGAPADRDADWVADRSANRTGEGAVPFDPATGDPAGAGSIDPASVRPGEGDMAGEDAPQGSRAGEVFRNGMTG